MGFLFLHDNVFAHRSEVALKAIFNAGFEIIEIPPYSPDLAPSDFHLFPKLKEHIRGNKFEDDDAVMAVVDEFFESQDHDFYSEVIRKFESGILKGSINRITVNPYFSPKILNFTLNLHSK